jgi:hypothetical protein
MTEAVTIDNEELAILCDIVSGWGVRKWVENPGAAKKQSLDDSSRVRRTSKHSFRHDIPAHSQDRDSFCPALCRNKRRVSCPATAVLTASLIRSVESTYCIIAKRASIQPSAMTKALAIASILRRRAFMATLARLASTARCRLRRLLAASVACLCIRAISRARRSCAVRTCRCVGISLIALPCASAALQASTRASILRAQ